MSLLDKICKRAPVLDLMGSQVIPVPPKAPHYTLREWYLTNTERYRNSEDQHQLADRLIADAERMMEESSDVATTNKREVEHQIDVKVKDIEFLKSQVERQKKDLDLEIEAMLTYKERILDAQESLGNKALEICKKCLVLREGRLGIDLCEDDVQLELNKEVELLEGVKAMLVRILEQTNEQVRRLRAMNYSLIRDLEDKSNVLNIERRNTSLSEHSLNLSLYHGSAPLDPANITQEEWIANSQGNIEAAHKELVSGIPLRAYIDTLLKQIIEDLWKQYYIVNDAFKRRISETKEAKAKLENQHFETVRQANEMSMTITKLEKSLAEQGSFMALAHTRLGNRCQRSGLELCRDEAETYLLYEVSQIKDIVTKLQQKLMDANASLRYLLRTQVQLEEDINVKTNTLKIDEVECMTLRQCMDYHAY